MTWKPEPIPTVRDKPGTKTKTGRTKPDTQAEWLGRSFRKISTWTRGIQAQVDALGGIITYGASITDDAGDGTPHGDLNATDFTGHPHAIGTALEIKSNAVVTFGHKVVAYIWEGPSGVTVGVGGSYTAVSTDLVPIGTADHAILVNRDVADSHPTSAITNLDSEQQQQNTDITQNANTIANHIGNLSNPHQVNHSQLPDVGTDPADPHPQYVNEGFGGIMKTTDTNYGTVGSGAWTTIDNWDEGMVFSPVGVTQDVANSGLRVTAQGVYKVTGTIAVSFTDTNQGRIFGVRMWNDTQSIAGRIVEYFVGRNQDGVNISQGALLFEVGVPEIDDLFQLQIAGVGDSFSNVAVIDALFSVARVG